MSASSSGQVKVALSDGAGFVDLAWSLPDAAGPEDRRLVASLLHAIGDHLDPDKLGDWSNMPPLHPDRMDPPRPGAGQ